MNIRTQFIDLPVLETERLILRKLTMKDAEDVFEYASNPEVSKYVGWEYHKSIEDSKSFIRLMLKKYRKRKISAWCIVLKENDKLIGTCGFISYIRNHERAQIGFSLSWKYWNKGLMTEAIKEVIRFGFEVLMLNRIESICLLENSASERTMQKAGMEYEGILRKYLYTKGKYHDVKMYAILSGS